MSLLLRGARIVDPVNPGVPVTRDLGVRDGRIVEPVRDEPWDEMIDAGGCIAMAGGVRSSLNLLLVAVTFDDRGVVLINGDALRARSITYVPDFVANAGGAIYLCRVLAGWAEEQVNAAVESIFDTSVEVLKDAERDGTATQQAAERLAETRLGRPVS